MDRIFSSLKRGSYQAFILNSVGLLLVAVMHFVIANRLGSGEYGVLIYGITVAGLFALLLPIGWPNAVLRQAVGYIRASDWPRFKGVLLRSHQFVVSASIVVAILLVVTSMLLDTPKYKSGFLAAGLMLPFMALFELRKKTFQALERIKSSIVPEQILLPISIIGVLLLVKVDSAILFAYIYAAILMIIAVGAYMWLWRCLPSQVKYIGTIYETKAWLAIALPMMFGSIGQIFLTRVDILILGYFQDMSDVGIYSAANRIAGLCVFILEAVSAMASPLLAKAYHDNQPRQFIGIMRKTTIWSAVLTLPIFLVIVMYPALILSLFGSEFEGGDNILRLLAIGQMVNASVGPVGIALLMAGGERHFAVSVLFVATINVVAHFLMIPIMGVIGAAIVTAASVILINVSQLIILNRLIKRWMM